jgi:hypothetical protein
LACDTIEITIGENPDIIFEFFAGEKDTDPRLDLNGGIVTASSNVPGWLQPAIEEVDLIQGIIAIPVPEAVSNTLKPYTPYTITLRAVDADGKIHKAVLNVSAKQ